MPTKLFYTTTEVSELLDIPASTLRYWEEIFPMLNPERNPGEGRNRRRRYTKTDVSIVKHIKELLYGKGMKIEAAIEVMNKTHRKSFPTKRPVCTSTRGAIKLLDEVKAITEDAHALAKIEVVIKFLSSEH